MITLKRYRMSDDNQPGVLYYESNSGRRVAVSAARTLRARGYRCTAEENVCGTWKPIREDE